LHKMKSRTLRSAIALLTVGIAACTSGGAAAPGERAATTDEALYGLGELGGRWPGGVVPVCFSAESVAYPNLRAQIPTILCLLWGRAGNVTFTGFGACTGGNEVAIFFADNSTGVTDHR